MPKRIIVLLPDGTRRDVATLPSLKELQTLVGGHIEHVAVVDRVEDGKPFYTSMYVNDTGMIDGLPRNAQATTLYQRACRLAFQDAPDPFHAAEEAYRASLPPDIHIIDARPEIPGYAEDPWICGPAVYFEGWTIEEVNEAYE